MKFIFLDEGINDCKFISNILIKVQRFKENNIYTFDNKKI